MSSKRQRSEGEGKSDGDELVTVLESRAMEMLLTHIRNKDLQSRFVGAYERAMPVTGHASLWSRSISRWSHSSVETMRLCWPIGATVVHHTYVTHRTLAHDSQPTMPNQL